MTDVLWTERARSDLMEICDFIAEHDPNAALRIGQTVIDQIARLADFPRRGRPGRVSETRELVLTDLPYIAVYRLIDPDQVAVLRILHDARRWPPE